MNVILFSERSSYHHLAQLLEKESNVDNIYHLGANRSLEKTDRYHPIPCDIVNHYNIPQSSLDVFYNLIKNHGKIDLVMSSTAGVIRSHDINIMLEELNIPHFFPYPGMHKLEYDRITAKRMLNNYNIPTMQGKMMTGSQLKESFMTMPRPFVIKITGTGTYLHGRQTIIVDNHNYEEVYLDLFSIHVGQKSSITNVKLDWNIWIEDFIKLKREYSYHMLINQNDWTFLGAARDYKRYNEGDEGFNTMGIGAYNIENTHPEIHRYAETIFKVIQTHVKPMGKYYRGFLYLGIGIDENDKAWVLEINTRNGEPELDVILPTITSNLAELFIKTSINDPIPSIVRNDKKIVTMRLVNKIYDWTKPAISIPNLNLDELPKDVTCSIDSTDNDDNYYLTHSLFTAIADTYIDANKKITHYLNSQDLGQFRFRNDIGILE